MHSKLCGVIAYPCPRYLLLAPKFRFVHKCKTLDVLAISRVMIAQSWENTLAGLRGANAFSASVTIFSSSSSNAIQISETYTNQLYSNELWHLHFKHKHLEYTVPGNLSFHDDFIKWKHFTRYWPFVRENHRSPVKCPHKDQWRRALMLCLICAWVNGWVNNGEAWWFETPSHPLWRHCNVLPISSWFHLGGQPWRLRCSRKHQCLCVIYRIDFHGVLFVNFCHPVF